MHFQNPPTRYARARDGAFLGYQRFGEGPVTVVVVPGQASHLEHQWDFPVQTQWLRRIARFADVVVFDPRGCGVSDRVLGDPEDFVGMFAADLVAVMDHAEVPVAAVVGQFHSGPACIRTAVDHPDRVSRLILDGTYARWRRAPDYPAGMREPVVDTMIEVVAANWGNGRTIEFFAPSLADDERQREAFAQYERMATSPGLVRSLTSRWLDQDVRALLGALTQPTLVLHRLHDRLVLVGHGRYLAENIAGARYVEAPEGDHILTGRALDDQVGEYARFLVGPTATAMVTRAMATVMFVDIASSTEQATRVGDGAWRTVLDDFRRIVRREVRRFGGREINTRGDDFLVVFDLPTVAIAAAQSIRDDVSDLGLAVRAGIHVGEIELHGDDVAGVTVHVAARIEALADAGQVLVSGTVADTAVGADLPLTELGAHHLKGIPGAWRVLVVDDPAPRVRS